MHHARTTATTLTLLVLLGLVPALRAQEFSPHAGTWAILEEVNGKPGRGFQIDVQNDILVLYFYGYETNGASTYWLAAGRIPAGSNQLTADLGAYEGGMAFGDPFKNATYVGPRGQVTIRFTALTRGEICLPSESCKAIGAFNFGFEDSASALLGLWYGNGIDSRDNTIDGFAVRFTQVAASTDPRFIDRASGTLLTNVDGAAAEVPIVCDKLRTPNPWQFECTIDPQGDASRFSISVSRNAFVGQYYDESDMTVEGNLIGHRSRTATGKIVLPD